MPSAATSGALSGAASGAATGTAIMPGWGTAIGAVVGGVGGYLSASGTADAQSAQNRAGDKQAAMQSAQAFSNYLASRGISIQQVAAANPQLEAEYERVRAAGDRRDFNTWLFEHLRNAPSDPVWAQINSGQVGTANTTLPTWAVDENGNPLQPAMLQQLVAQSNAGRTAQQAAIVQGWASGGGANLRNVWDAATPEEQAAYGSFENFVRADYEANASPEQKAVITAAVPGAAAGPAGTGSNLTLDPAIAALIPQATTTLGGVFDGTFLNQTNAALQPIAAARTADAAAQAARIIEQRGLSGALLGTELAGIGGVTAARTAGAGGVFDASTAAAQGVHDANVAKLAELLGVRREAAQQIYDASIAGAGGVREARTTGAQGIYDAELRVADTYGQANEQALARMLAQQGAERARRGFTGGSSGSNIVDARLTAEALQRGAGVRAGAGVGYQSRLSDAGVGYATDARTAGVGRATTIGQSNEADAAAKLTAAVDLAKSLGLAGTNRATTMAGTGEQDAIARLQAQVADATRRLGYLTSDGDIAKANADLKNAQDALTALTNDQNRKIGAIGAPFNLAGLDLGLKDKLTSQQYAGIDALMARLGSFNVGGASGPGLNTAMPGSVLNNSQIAGGVLSGVGSTVSNYASNKELMDLINSLNLGRGASTTPTATPTGSAGTLTTPSNFLGNSSVFTGPPPRG